MSLLLHPMYKLLKANVKWNWDDQCNKAFEEAKRKLMEAPVLAHYMIMGLEPSSHTVMKMAMNSP